MKERDDTVYLKHILDAIARIEGYLSGVNQETFTKTMLLQDGRDPPPKAGENKEV